MTDAPRTYRLYRQLGDYLQCVLFAGFLVIGGSIVFTTLVDIAKRRRAEPFLLVLGSACFAFTAALLVMWLRMPRTLVWNGDGSVTLVAQLRTLSIQVAEIESLLPHGRGLFELRGAGRRVLLYNQFDGFHDFVRRLLEANPDAAVRGC